MAFKPYEQPAEKRKDWSDYVGQALPMIGTVGGGIVGGIYGGPAGAMAGAQLGGGLGSGLAGIISPYQERSDAMMSGAGAALGAGARTIAQSPLGARWQGQVEDEWKQQDAAKRYGTISPAQAAAQQQQTNTAAIKPMVKSPYGGLQIQDDPFARYA